MPILPPGHKSRKSGRGAGETPNKSTLGRDGLHGNWFNSLARKDHRRITLSQDQIHSAILSAAISTAAPSPLLSGGRHHAFRLGENLPLRRRRARPAALPFQRHCEGKRAPALDKTMASSPGRVEYFSRGLPIHYGSTCCGKFMRREFVKSIAKSVLSSKVYGLSYRLGYHIMGTTKISRSSNREILHT